jgi:hypothetical protein
MLVDVGDEAVGDVVLFAAFHRIVDLPHILETGGILDDLPGGGTASLAGAVVPDGDATSRHTNDPQFRQALAKICPSPLVTTLGLSQHISMDSSELSGWPGGGREARKPANGEKLIECWGSLGMPDRSILSCFQNPFG